MIGFFRKGLINLSAWFVPVKVHGKWVTTLNGPGPRSSGSSPTDPQGGSNVGGPHSHKSHENVTLHQFFNKVWGEAVVRNSKDVYKVRGQLVGEKLSLIFREKKSFDSGAILLKVMSRTVMEGYEVGVNPKGNIYSKVYIWERRVD